MSYESYDDIDIMTEKRLVVLHGITKNNMLIKAMNTCEARTFTLCISYVPRLLARSCFAGNTAILFE